MIVTVFQVIVTVFGAVICAFSAWGIYAPGNLIRFVERVMERNSGIYAAIIVRMVLGLALIATAAESRFPLVFRALGSIAIVAALGLAIIGRERMRRFAAWFDRLPPEFIRLWLVFGIAFGGFLIYGLF